MYIILMTILWDNSNIYIHFTDEGTKHTKLSNSPKDSELINGKDGILSAARAGALNQDTKLTFQVCTN